MSTKCRVWWPKELSSSIFELAKSSSSSTSTRRSVLLFGWFISCSPTSIDVVVAFAFPDHLHSSDSAIQEALCHTNGGVPVLLQEKCSLTALGCCVLPYENTNCMQKSNVSDGDDNLPSKYTEALSLNGQHTSLANPRNSRGRSLEYDGLLEKNRHASLCGSTWIQLVLDDHSYSSIEICCIPTLDYLCWNGKLLSQAELHVMIYETPRYGSHHYAIKSCSKLINSPPKRPKWIDELHHKPQLIDLDTIILAMNCSAAANMFFSKHLGLQTSSGLLVLYMFVDFIWRLWATIVATLSTFLFIVVQLFNKLARCQSHFWMCTALAKLFSNTWRNIQLRCHQILYWPIILNEAGLRSQTCVEYAEKSGLRRHSMWSAAAIDIFFGNLAGYALSIHAEAILKWFSSFAIHFTDDVLRTGCVWLMGVPAGFKLNTELAGVFGIISLNAIQIWSTLWFSATDIFSYAVKVVALSGILLGITIPVALITDMIAIATFHVYALHSLISLLYSLQIQALTALWRLFRGRKWNPLRQRLDSYEYSVEQHVVGSLLFTPLLLLLPTTSIFYVFFAIMNLTIIFSLTLIEINISIIHDTPYSKILLWLVRSKRFPSGIWFETIHRQSDSNVSVAVGFLTGSTSSCNNMPQDENLNCRKSPPLLSFLRSNIFTFGQVVFPHYKNIFCGVHGQTLRSAISGILTGKCTSTKLCSESPNLPWISISYRDYWYGCYNAVLGRCQCPGPGVPACVQCPSSRQACHNVDQTSQQKSYHSKSCGSH